MWLFLKEGIWCQHVSTKMVSYLLDQKDQENKWKILMETDYSP